MMCRRKDTAPRQIKSHKFRTSQHEIKILNESLILLPTWSSRFRETEVRKLPAQFTIIDVVASVLTDILEMLAD